MTILKLAWRNIVLKPLSSSLSAILFAISITIIILLSIVSHQLEEKFQKNRRQVHMVVGAPGSKMDLILSSIYHITPPVQNVKIKDCGIVLANLDRVDVVPLALGDHYAFDPDPDNPDPDEIERRRIVGTDSSYLELYDVSVEKGRLFDAPMEATIGHEVHVLGLNMGDQFVGVHGVATDGHVHEDQVYTVVGIMEQSGTVLDQLVLCSVESVWMVHEGHDGHAQSNARVKKFEREIQPKPDPLEAAALGPGERDSLAGIISQKLDNIGRLLGKYRVNGDTLLADKKDVKLDIARVRSNIRAIIGATRKLSGEIFLGDDPSTFPDTVAQVGVEDSFRLSIEQDFYDIARLSEEIRLSLGLNTGLGSDGLAAYRAAIALEGKTYDIVNGYTRMEQDATLRMFRERNKDMLANRKVHYLLDHPDKEITSLLVTYKEGLGGFDLARQIEEYYQGKLNVAMVEMQVQKLYELIEPGVEYIRLLAYLIMIISGLSVLISLVKALRERKYEMALMRVMGATRLKIFALVVIEGLLLSIMGFLLGFVLSHIVAEVMAGFLEDRYHYNFTGFIFLKSELQIFLGTLGIGFAAAILPAIMAIFTNISATLSNK